jgi:DNA polymerase
MTFPIENLVFFDFESRCDVDLKKHGTYRYADRAEPILLTYAIGDAPVRVVQANGEALTYPGLPGELRAAIENSEMTLVAWNSEFDRAIWNYSLADSPFLEPRRVVDAMAQGTASNLPGALDQASTALGGPGKQPDGKQLIGMFCGSDARDPKEWPTEWDRFIRYALRDTDVLRDVWKKTRPMSMMEWRVFWANCAITERGIGIDRDFCAAASRLAIEDGTRAGRRLAEITGGLITSIFQHERIATFLYDRLPPVAQNIMITAVIDPEDREENDDAEGEPLIKTSVQREIVGRLLDWMDASKHDDPVVREILELREFGASAAPKKYAAAMAQETGGRLRGQIVYGGAPQTGRFSGKGVQPQNLTRTPLGPPGDDYGIWEPGGVDMIAEGCSLDELAAYGSEKIVPSRKLALLVRPAIVAPEGRTLVKADYSQIEARGLPWLANTPSAHKLLDYFRAVDADPAMPDLYTITAAGMLRKHVGEITKGERQIGKVSTLACGYAGGKGAFISMAANYRFYVSPEEAQDHVDKWRIANPWAPTFWGRHNSQESYGLWGAAMRAYNTPREPMRAGRIAFIYEPAYLGGTLLMRLPSGRLLSYPWCKWREYEVKDKRTGKVKETRSSLTFRRPGGMRALYGGLLAENATQACCADLLRESLVILEEGLLESRLDVVLHAHDEIVAEVDDNPRAVRAALELLDKSMTMERSWSKGFPITIDAVVRFYYSAAKPKENHHA